MNVDKDVALAPFTTFRVGGPAARLVTVTDAADIPEVLAETARLDEPLLVLAGGSNLLISDDGFPGTVLHLRNRGIDVLRDGDTARVTVQAGETWDDLVALTVADGLAGIEALSGIPGSAGATPIQNVGAYGQEVADVITQVFVRDRLLSTSYSLTPEHCGFAYRDSLFKRSNRFVVTAVEFTLRADAGLGTPVRYAELARSLGVEVGERAPVTAVRETVLGLRRGKGMVLDEADHDTWSAGSFFTNPFVEPDRVPAGAPAYPQPDGRVKTSAAWLIEHAGFAKGHGTPPATLSTKHTLALTNRGGARAQDLLALAREVRDGVQKVYGIELHHEPVLIGHQL